MSSTTPVEAGRKSYLRGFWLLAILLISILAVLFFESFIPGKVIFSNDGPLGAISSKAASLPSGFHGLWEDLTWIGGESVGARPSFSVTMALLLKPVGYSKFFLPIALLGLGLSAWLFFRQLKLAPIACVVAGLAAALNSDFFSTGCWGVVAQPVCFAFNYLALAGLANPSARRPWIRVMLAGFAVGLAVMEGFDIGAIFSLFVAAYVVFQSWNTEGGSPTSKKLSSGFLRLAVVTVFAGFIAIQTLDALVGTQIKGIVGTDQDAQTKQQQWGFATQWSVPKLETLQVLIPGVFGYRMDTPGGAVYWGSIGQHPMVPELVKALSSPDEQTRAQAADFLNDGRVWRFAGSGLYAGVLVVVIAFWGVLQSFRNKGSPFSLVQRRSIWFWLAVAIVGLLMGFGKYAPLYQVFYAIPYASTIRNPFKWMHVFHWALIVLFAYGLHGLVRAYLQNPVTRVQGLFAQFKNWRAKAAPFDRKWMTGCFVVAGAAVLGWMIYSSSSTNLKAYLQTIGIDAGSAPGIARFSIAAVGWFALFLVLTVGLLALIFSGQFSGPRAAWGGALLGLLLVTDLTRANLPWIVYWDYPYKYATNPIIDFLRDKPYEHRVSMAPLQSNDPQFSLFQSVYGLEWIQQLFPYYNIQSPDLVQEPREAADNNAFRKAISARNPATLARLWQLTNTRYLLGPAGGVDALNQLDPVQRRFRIEQRFMMTPKHAAATSAMDFTATPDPNGSLAVIDFTGALPRAKLYSNWQVNPDRETTLSRLADPAFDPQQTVIVADPIAAPAPGSTNQPAGTVQIKPNYEPKRIELEADVKTPAVLLLNDKFNPKWQVSVDGKPQSLLRCNFIMRGVYLQPGHHDIVFQFVSFQNTLYLSLAAVLMALSLCAWLALDKPGEKPALPVSPAVADKNKAAKA